MDDKEVMHVYPLHDLREHDVNSSGACWCSPALSVAPNGVIYIHTSADGREAYEEGRRKPH